MALRRNGKYFQGRLSLVHHRPVTFFSPWLRRGVLIAGVIGLGIWSLATIRFQTELLPLFPPELASVQQLQKAQTTVSSEREVIVLTQPNPGWPALQKLADAIKGQPGIGEAHVGLGSSQPPAQWLAGLFAGLSPKRFTAIQQTLQPDSIKARLAETRQQMSGAIDETDIGRLHFDPLRLQEVAFAGSGDKRSLDMANVPTILTIVADRSLQTFEDDQKFVSQVHAALAPHASEFPPGTQFLLTGQPAITADVSQHMQRDLVVMLSFTIALISLAFWLFYRSLMPLLWIIASQLLALFCALTVARFLFHEINILSIGFSSILLGVGMDYCILVYHHFAQPNELDPCQWRQLKRAIWLSSCTTAATFGVLYFSSFPGLRQLAILVGSGLLATAFFATTLLADHLSRHRPIAPSVLRKASDASAQFLFRQRIFFVAAIVLLVLGVAALAPRWISYSFYNPSIEALEPTHLESVRTGKILQSLMPVPTHSGNHAEQNRVAWKPLSTDKITAAFQSAGFDATWSASTVQIADALNHWHTGTLDLTGPTQTETAWLQLRHDLNATAVHDFKRLSLLMLSVVIVLCTITHRSPRLVLLNLGALLLSLLVLGSLLFLTGNSLTLVSLLCIPLTIGLVIDYSLHILLALEQADGQLAPAFRHLGVPVILTGLASIIGFTAPMLSSQPALQNFGTVMDLGTVAAVMSGLIFLPALYSVTQRTSGATTRSSSLYCASLFGFCCTIARVLPLPANRLIAYVMGRLYALAHPSRVALVQQNLSLLDARMTPIRARRVFGEFGRTLADYFYIGTRSRPEVMQLISQHTGVEHIHEAHRQGKGGIIVTAHFGLFELGGLFTAAQGMPVDILTFPEPSVALTEWRAQFRKRWGVNTIEIGPDPFAFFSVAQCLRKNHFVAALIDRPSPSETVNVRLPHGVAGFSSGILLLAAHTGTPVIPATMARQNDGTYHAHIFAPITITQRGSRAETLDFYTQKIADILLPDLCAHPEQWYQFAPLSPSVS